MEFFRVKYHGFLVYCDWLIVFLCRNPTMKWNLCRLFSTVDKNRHFFTNWFRLCAVGQNYLNFLRREARRLHYVLFKKKSINQNKLGRKNYHRLPGNKR